MKCTTETTGTMILETITAVALWEHEIQGQLSDGMWENTAPHDHYHFWCKVNAYIGESNKVVQNRSYPKKTTYGLERLIPEVGDRMILRAKLALCGIEPTWENVDLHEKDPIVNNTVYIMKDLRQDLKHIKEAMKSVK